jgi:pyruvate dehydrogenase E1 component alpha subunit
MALNKEKLLNMYETMVKIRKFEEKTNDLFLDGKIPGFVHLYIGEEAIATGVCANLTNDDQIASTHRGHGHCIAKGGELDLMMAELFGKSTGYCKGKGGSMHIADRDLGILGANGIVGAGMPIATGAAFAMKYNKTDQVSVVFFGDGASNRGTFHEALNMASTWKLPVVFVNENNGMGLYTKQSKHQNVKDVADRAHGYGIKGVTADGNDVLAVYEVANEAIKHAREGKGPTLIEFKTWRQRGHFVGDAELYRTEEEKQEWMKKDPIPRYEKYLIESETATKEELQAIKNKVDGMVGKAVQFADESPYPNVEELIEGTYA